MNTTPKSAAALADEIKRLAGQYAEVYQHGNKIFNPGGSYSLAWVTLTDAIDRLAALAQQPAEPGAILGWLRLHPSGEPSGEYLTDACIEEVRKRSGQWVPLVSAFAVQQPEPKRVTEALDEVLGSFDAAFTEGLAEVLAETTDERLKDLVERRLLVGRDNALALVGAEVKGDA